MTITCTARRLALLASPFILLVASTQSAQAMGGGKHVAPEGACATHDSKLLKRTVRYCIDIAASTDLKEVPLQNRKVLFFFHGNGQPIERWFTSYTADFHKQVEALDTPQSTIAIGFEAPHGSFYTDKMGLSWGPEAWESWFVTEFVPYITEIYGICPGRECRSAVGFSMGGFGALKTALRHPDLFHEVAVGAAALSTFNIFESDWKWSNYFSKTPVGPVVGLKMLKDVRPIFGTAQYYDENDPILLVRDYPAKTPFPRLYIEVRNVDLFGFERGAALLMKTLDQRGLPYEFKQVPGVGHTSYEHWPHVAEFLFRNDRGAPAYAEN